MSGLPQFNRYFHLFKMWKLGLWDYVLYLDADAMIADLGNSIPDLFEDLKEDAAEDEDVLVHVTSLHKRGTPKWGVKSEAFLFNNGVFLLNMKHSCVGHFLK